MVKHKSTRRDSRLTRNSPSGLATVASTTFRWNRWFDQGDQGTDLQQADKTQGKATRATAEAVDHHRTRSYLLVAARVGRKASIFCLSAARTSNFPPFWAELWVNHIDGGGGAIVGLRAAPLRSLLRRSVKVFPTLPLFRGITTRPLLRAESYSTGEKRPARVPRELYILPHSLRLNSLAGICYRSQVRERRCIHPNKWLLFVPELHTAGEKVAETVAV